MLILTRQLQEAINVGDNVKVTVLAVNGSQVRLGIEAPKDVPVHREEIYDRIHHGVAASSSSLSMDSHNQDEQEEHRDGNKKVPTILTRKRRSWQG